MELRTTGILDLLAANKGSYIEKLTAPPKDEELREVFVIKHASGEVITEILPEQFKDMHRERRISEVSGSHVHANARFDLIPNE